jgi:hypothetical protein
MGSSSPPNDASELSVIVTVNFGDTGFFWSINPGVEVIHDMVSSTENATLHFSLADEAGSGSARWNPTGDFLTFNASVDPSLYELQGTGGNSERTLVLKPGFPTGPQFFTLHIQYNAPGRDGWTDAALDPELDVGMQGQDR